MKINQGKFHIISYYKIITDINLYLCIIFNLFFIPSYLSKKNLYSFRELNLDSEITLKIKGNGTQDIIYPWGTPTPSQIYINGELQSTTGKSVSLEKEENTIRMIFNSAFTSCANFFAYMNNIVEVDLSKFDASSITDMGNMFKSCSALTSLKIGKIDTSSVTSMGGMFYGCSHLTSLDLNGLNTSNVESMENMLYECSNLKEIHMDNFDTEKVTKMNGMFFHCLSLTTLDLSSFKTSSLVSVANMFENCASLISLNVENFDTSNNEAFNLMFYGCSSLISLNLKSFNTSKNSGSHSVFTGVPSQLIFCADMTKLETFKNMISFTENCNDTCFSGNNPKLIINKKQCTLNCQNDDTYIYEYKNLCFQECPEGTHALPDNRFLCLNIQEGVFLDENNEYQSCYEKCLYCREKGNEDNHKCLECISEYIFLNETNLENNCYEKCPYNYYFDSNNIYHCTESDSCPQNYEKKINEKKKCIERCQKDDTYKYEYNNICYVKCPNNTYIENDDICYEKEVEVSSNIISDNIKDTIDYTDNSYINTDINTENNIENTDSNTENNIDSTDSNTENNIDSTDINTENNIENTDSNTENNIDSTDSNTENNIDSTDSGSEIDNNGNHNDQSNYNENSNESCYSSCASCSGQGDSNNNNCLECIKNYILIKSPQNYSNCYIKCEYYYYFDSSNNYYCTDNNDCPPEQSKLIKSKKKCINDCSKDDIYIYEENNICVKFISQDGKILICPINLPYEKSQECVEACTSEEFLNKECIINNKNNKTAQDNIIQSIKTDLTNGNLKSILSNVINGSKTDFVLEDTDAIYQLTSSDNQKNNDYQNVSSILLGDCEDKLKETYDISEDEPLLIFKIDVLEKGLNIPIIEYEIYHPLTLEKLELDCCNDTKIGISIPVSINEDYLFKYNSSNDYYNDLCYSYTTETGTDLVMRDRQKEYKNNNYSLCESNCDYTNYNTTTKKAFCECKPKGTFTSISDIKDSPDKLLTSFKDLKNAINLEIMKCYSLLLSKEGLIKNIGSYVLLFTIGIHIISVFLFIAKGYNIIHQTVNNLVKQLIDNMNKKEEKNHENNKEEKNHKDHKTKKDDKKEKKNKNNKEEKDAANKKGNKNKKSNKKLKYSSSTKTMLKNNIKEKNKRKNIKSKTTKKITTVEKHNPVGRRKKNKISTKILSDEYNSKSNTNTKLNLKELKYLDKRGSPRKKSQKITILKIKNSVNFINIGYNEFRLKFLNYNDYELNNLLYQEALKIDKRTYWQYYWSLLKQKHLLIFSFYTSNDYNSKIIKICLFFFSFCLYYTVNALFFNYNTLHKIYQDQGKFNFIFQIPQILYSTLISTFINILVKTLSLSQKNIIELKNQKHSSNLNSKKNNLLKCLYIKFITFFVLSFLLLLFFWYYLGCFCAVYKNSQKHLFNDTLISFLLSLLYPIFLNLLPGLFRIPSLKDVNKNKEGLYKFSQLIQLI